MDTAASTVQFTERERAFVFAVAMKYMKDEEKAADVTQDALLSAFRHRGDFRGDSRFTTWLYRIAATTALMHLRKERSAQRLVVVPEGPRPGEEERADEPPSPAASPEEEWATSEAVELAGRSLEEMGEKYGQIFALRFLEGYSESEIARRLRLNVATVKTRAYRARTHVKEALTQALAAPPSLVRAA
jgi:RNA polymerase sigma-70 factor (ECF subfamily)